MPGWLMTAMILSCRYQAGHCHPQSCCCLGPWAGVRVHIPLGRLLHEHMLGKVKSQGRVWARASEYTNCPFHGQTGVCKSCMKQ